MKNYCYALLIGLMFGCKTPYQPVLNSKITNYLVVEGVINSSSTDTTFITLSRTVTLTSAVATKPELRAQVWVEDGQGFSVALQETLNKGIYVAKGLGLNTSKKYRLRIKTTENKTYLSDLVSVLPTPPIDSIGFYNKNTGIQIYANTHDPNNSTRYYRWDFTETWKFLPVYKSFYMTNGFGIVPRTPDQEYAASCWGTDVSKNVVINSSVKLTQDVIYQAPITYLEGSSDKISLRYSMLLRQYALTKEAYQFWEQLKKNTENLGSIFDAQPSESASNIYCMENAAEPVLGYVSAAEVKSKRVFFNKADLHIFAINDYATKCPLDSVLNQNPVTKSNDVQNLLVPSGSALIPVTAIYFGSPYPIGYMATSRICVDCSLKGAVKPPSFWKE